MRVLLLVHPQLQPHKVKAHNQTERDVYAGLKRLGHQVSVLPLQEEVTPLIEAIHKYRPHIAFNLLEEFLDEACFDFHPVAVLEAHKVPYTGCNPRGLALSRPKHIAKAVAHDLGLATARGKLVNGSKLANYKLQFPLIVKLNREDASRGLTQKNVVHSKSELNTCLKKLHRQFQSEMLVEEFIVGQDITLSLLGNDKPQALAAWQLHLPSGQHISSEIIKFSSKTRFKQGIRAARASLTRALQSRLIRLSRQLYRELELSGYARFDFRLSQDGTLYFLEANANPNLARREDFAYAAKFRNISYDDLLAKILKLGRSYRPRL